MNTNRLCTLVLSVLMIGTTMVPTEAPAQERKKILAHSMSTVTIDWFAKQRDEVKEVCAKRGVTHWFVDGQNRADKQIADLEDLAVKKPDIVLINTMFADAIKPGVDALARAGIPIVVLSSPLGKGMKMDCWVSGDTGEITRQSAEYMAKVANYEGNWVQIEGQPGSLINKTRGDSWNAVFSKYPGFKRIGPFIGNYVRHEALRIMEDVLNSHKEYIKVVYCHNDEMALGAIQALKEVGRLKGTYVVGDNAQMEEVKEAIVRGDMFMSNRWPTFGKEAASVACDYLIEGKPLPEKVLAPVYLARKDTLDKW
jgi:ribose transport system substrate-binding protein